MEVFSEEDYQTVFDQKVKTVLFTVQKSLSLLRTAVPFLLTTSVAKVKGSPGATGYSAAQAAVRSFARTWTDELKGRYIRVNAISRGPIDTALHAKASAANSENGKAIAGILAAIPMGRIGQPDEIAKVVCFHASDDSSFVSGIEMMVDGGTTQV